MPNNIATNIYIISSLAIIAVLLYMNHRQSCIQEPLCLCTGFGEKLYGNREELEASYDAGHTEYQKFYKPKVVWKSTNFNTY